MLMTRVDLNADLGESFGAYSIGDDEAMLKLITSANVACGFHGGDPVVMAQTIQSAKAKGVGIGAHPGLNDLWGFGRRRIAVQDVDEIEKMVVYQIGAIMGMARASGTEVTHCKVHGALNNMAAEDFALALATARAVKSVDPEMIFVVPPQSELERAGEEAGLTLAREIFADRAYDDQAMLVARGQPGAMIHDAEDAAARIVKFVRQGAIESLSGKRIDMPIDTICVHGDSPASVAIASAVRIALAEAGVEIAPMAHSLSR